MVFSSTEENSVASWNSTCVNDSILTVNLHIQNATTIVFLLAQTINAEAYKHPKEQLKSILWKLCLFNGIQLHVLDRVGGRRRQKQNENQFVKLKFCVKIGCTIV